MERPVEQPPAPPRRGVPRLYRKRRGAGGWLLGLCAGIGEHLGVDPILVRLICVLLLFTLAAGLSVALVYLLFALFIPYEPELPE